MIPLQFINEWFPPPLILEKQSGITRWPYLGVSSLAFFRRSPFCGTLAAAAVAVESSIFRSCSFKTKDKSRRNFAQLSTFPCSPLGARRTGARVVFVYALRKNMGPDYPTGISLAHPFLVLEFGWWAGYCPKVVTISSKALIVKAIPSAFLRLSERESWFGRD